MVNQQQENLEEFVYSYIKRLHANLMLHRDNEPLDGDETKNISKIVLKQLDSLNGND